jgi:hypothetical protein
MSKAKGKTEEGKGKFKTVDAILIALGVGGVIGYLYLRKEAKRLGIDIPYLLEIKMRKLLEPAARKTKGTRTEEIIDDALGRKKEEIGEFHDYVNARRIKITYENGRSQMHDLGTIFQVYHAPDGSYIIFNPSNKGLKAADVPVLLESENKWYSVVRKKPDFIKEKSLFRQDELDLLKTGDDYLIELFQGTFDNR